ncbi:MAG TPA: hypothetical protein VFI17_05140 [Solirubrobacterales bacterium]|nr:hypothetical protein [Solirubrobacterales bacterium]
MRHKRLLGILGVAALLTAAALAVASADAVTLCRVNENPTCSEENSYRVPTLFAAELERTTSATFSGTPSVTCGESWGSGETTVAGTPLIGESSNVNFASCGGCTTVEAQNLPWVGEVEATGGGNGTLTAYGASKTNLSVKLTSCLSGATCFYGVESATAEIEGGESAKFTIVKVLNREPGSNKLLCATTSTFTGNYRLTTPTEPVFISALP